MSTVNSGYDPELRMYAERPREPDRKHLAFLRWLAEHGRLEHAPLGRPSGQYAHSSGRDGRSGAAERLPEQGLPQRLHDR